MISDEDLGGDDLERIVEGDDALAPEEPPQNNEEEEAVERRVVKPKKRVLQPRPKLDPQRLNGPRGIGLLESVFSDIKFKDHGNEIYNLNMTLARLEHWAHRLFAKMTFDDCLDRIEDIGTKREVSTYVTKLRLGMEEVVAENRASSPINDNVEDSLGLFRNPSPEVCNPQGISEEQRMRMLKNRQLAEERRLARMRETNTEERN